MVKFVARATPFYVIGDSHTLAFSDLVFEERGAFDTTFVAHAKFCGGLGANNFCDAAGAFHPALEAALVSEGLLQRADDGGLVATHRVSLGVALALNVTSQRTRTAPALLIFAGNMDLRTIFLRELAQTDFTLPATIPYDPARYPSYALPATIPFALARELAAKLLAPLFRGLERLSDLGFTNLYVHSLAPMSLDDDAFERIVRFRAPAGLRYKATLLYNALLRDFVAQHPAIRMIDAWERFTVDGALDPQYLLDHAHLNRRAAHVTVEMLLGDLARRGTATRRDRYDDAARAARAAFAAGPPHPELAAAFRRGETPIVNFGPAFAQRLVRHIAERLDPGGGVAAGWTGDPFEPSTLVQPRATAELVREVGAAIFSPEARDVLVSCLGSEYTVLNLRVIRALAHEALLDGMRTRAVPLAALPPGVVRGMLYLEDAPAEGITAGMLRLCPLASPEAGAGAAAANVAFLELFIAPLIPGRPPRIVCAPPNTYWPQDPYECDTTGMLVGEFPR